MNLQRLLFFFLLVFYSQSNAQEINSKIDKDSLFYALVKDVPSDKKKELTEGYAQGNDQTKNLFIFMLNLPKSSKAEMIANLENKKTELLFLKSEYEKIVPKGYVVFVEFNAEDKVFQTPASINLHIYGNTAAEKPGGSNLEYGSIELKKSLSYIGWNENTLETVKKMLDDAGCVSVKNGKITEIGFARSGMGKYSYRIFNEKLNAKEIKEYNDGCTFIHYKDNIVLEYGGGAIGPQCFPD